MVPETVVLLVEVELTETCDRWAVGKVMPLMVSVTISPTAGGSSLYYSSRSPSKVISAP